MKLIRNKVEHLINITHDLIQMLFNTDAVTEPTDREMKRITLSLWKWQKDRHSAIRNFQKHKVGNDGINVNFVFPYICSFLHYLGLKMLVNVKLDVN